MKRLSEKEIFKTKLFTVKDIVLETDKQASARSKNTTVTYQILEKADTSLIVPLLDSNTVLLIKEYFYAVDQWLIGLPKGRIENGSDPLETANRELQEEIGYKAQKLDKLGTLTMSPGYSTQKTHVFLARDLVESKTEGDEEYQINVIKHPLVILKI